MGIVGRRTINGSLAPGTSGFGWVWAGSLSANWRTEAEHWEIGVRRQCYAAESWRNGWKHSHVIDHHGHSGESTKVDHKFWTNSRDARLPVTWWYLQTALTGLVKEMPAAYFAANAPSFSRTLQLSITFLFQTELFPTKNRPESCDCFGS